VVELFPLVVELAPLVVELAPLVVEPTLPVLIALPVVSAPPVVSGTVYSQHATAPNATGTDASTTARIFFIVATLQLHRLLDMEQVHEGRVML
jgi:hypothetical protein